MRRRPAEASDRRDRHDRRVRRSWSRDRSAGVRRWTAGGSAALDLSERTDGAAGGSTRPGRCSSAAACRRDALVHLETGGALVFPDVPQSPVDEYRADAVHRRRAVRRAARPRLPGDARRRGSTPGRNGSRARPPTWSCRALHDAAIDSALDDDLARRGSPRGRRDGRPRDRAGQRRIPRRGSARAATAGGGVRGRHRRWTGGDGGRQPRRLPRRRHPMPTSTRPLAIVAGRAVVQAVDRRLGDRRRWTVRDRWPGGDGGIGDPDVVLRSRAAERVRRRDRQVLPELGARSDVAQPLRRRRDLPARGRPARCRRSSRTPARTTTPSPSSWPRWSSSGAGTGPQRCPHGRCSDALAGAKGFRHAIDARRRRSTRRSGSSRTPGRGADRAVRRKLGTACAGRRTPVAFCGGDDYHGVRHRHRRLGNEGRPGRSRHRDAGEGAVEDRHPAAVDAGRDGRRRDASCSTTSSGPDRPG